MVTFHSFFVGFCEQHHFGYEIFPDGYHLPVQDVRVHYREIGQQAYNPEREMSGLNLYVWADQWQRASAIVRSRLQAVLGAGNHKLPARVGVVRRIDQGTASHFLDNHHLQGSVSAKLKYGLFLPEKYFRLLPSDEQKPLAKELLISVMTFSNPRKYYLTDGSFIYSYELIRFASLVGFNVQGGFTKLLKFFIREKTPGNIMTYVDADWSDASNFLKFGFEIVANMPSLNFVNDENGNRKKTDRAEIATIKNQGSIKLILSDFEK